LKFDKTPTVFDGVASGLFLAIRRLLKRNQVCFKLGFYNNSVILWNASETFKEFPSQRFLNYDFGDNSYFDDVGEL
jgi:hypothetical protein